MQRVIGVLVFVMACGKGGGGGGAGSAGSAAPSAPAAAPAGKTVVAGTLRLSGAIEGTFSWKDDLAVDTCAWVPEVKSGGLGVSLTDGKGTFIQATATIDNAGKHTITLSSAKLQLPQASGLLGSEGVDVTGTLNGTTSKVDVKYDHAQVTADGQTVTIDGALHGTCVDTP
ncbi:MAG: hypothetical protein JO257_04695 [Deltaproteobacteria bacterium]|nr:hypothetical protein [Deltaproteobacteria bacterium]